MSVKQDSVLRITTAGSVDDGKSTLIGRLLYESNAILDDQLEALQKQQSNGGPIDLSLLTDGLKSEREQGITIDVAYKYFSSNQRKFILADAPGHVQYTRNMVTAASRADVAIVLIDARYGVQEQTRRHSYLAHLLGVQHVILAINKIDLIDYEKDKILAIEHELRELQWLKNHPSLVVVPLSALVGDNVKTLSVATPWYRGQPLLSILETLSNRTEERKSFQLPVQLVLRDSKGARFVAGTLTQGKLSVGDSVRILPSQQTSTVAELLVAGKSQSEALTGDAIAIALTDEHDLERGNFLVSTELATDGVQNFNAKLVWFDNEAYQSTERYLLRLGTQTTRATVESIEYRFDLSSLKPVPAQDIAMNDIVQVRMQSSRALFLEPYQTSKAGGSFILIDPQSFRTVAAGMVESTDRQRSVRREGGFQLVKSLQVPNSAESKVLQIPGAWLLANSPANQLAALANLLDSGWSLRVEGSPEAEKLRRSLQSLGFESYEDGLGI